MTGLARLEWLLPTGAGNQLSVFSRQHLREHHCADVQAGKDGSTTEGGEVRLSAFRRQQSGPGS
jgi:hypothetical protein